MTGTKTATTRALAYVRLSKEDQGATSPARQRATIAKLCKERGWVLADTYEDIGVSATAKRRPAFEQMMGRLDEADVVVVYRLDRLARSQIDFAKILERLADANVSLAATDMEVDNDSPAGTLVRDLVARLAQFERDQIASRSRAMHTYKRELGEPVGRVPFGWHRNGKRHEPDPAQQAVLRDAARRYVAGETYSAIAERHGLLVCPLSRMLTSERVQAALPAKLAEDLAAAIASRKMQRVPSSRTSLLGGIATCAVCGTGMARSSTHAGRPSGRWYQYRCPKAGHVGISGPWLENHVTTKVIDMVDTTKLVEELRARRERGERRSRTVSDIEARIELLDEMLVNGKITQARYERMNGELLDKLSRANRNERDNGADLPAELARELAKRWSDLDVGTRRRVIRAVLRDIVVFKSTGHGPITDGEKRVRLVWRLDRDDV
jgi:DNA invertase Pin-like site-specific DNA recombinase